MAALQSLGDCRDQASLVLGFPDEFSLEVLATKPATKFLRAFVNSCYDNYSNWLFPAASFTSMEAVDDGYAYHNKALAISHWGIATC